jgi:hypothetical protein
VRDERSVAADEIGVGRPAATQEGGRVMKRMLALVVVVVVAAIVAMAGPATATGSRGALHVTKECSQYDGTVGSFCTITSSNIDAITSGMRVVYQQAPGGGVLDADVVLSSEPGNAAFGHVLLDLTTARGRVTLSGGTGEFAGFQAWANVSVDKDGVWHWRGIYSFT